MKKTLGTSYPADSIAEIRQIREEIAAEHGYDIGNICRAMRRGQKASGCKYVDRSRRPLAGSRPARHPLASA